MGTLYMVATPIGNLEDITYRAVKALGEVDVVAAEDTRQVRKLLNRYSLRPGRVISCRARNERESAAGIVKLLDRGDDVAYVSDAGTPGVSDPGNLLARAVREAGFRVVPLPGPSAVAALVSVSGIPGKGFIFEGFLSPKRGRRIERLKELFSARMPFILYESPYRIVKLLGEIAALQPDRNLFLGREMTKKFEEFWSGKASQAAIEWGERDTIKGEFSVLVDGGKKG